ncbi:5'-methylthioinosine phosphorylase [Litorivivens lipolytica]|uniref:Probable S-methyl-5'-thioinosine phosphorylase n=1 Tax=Litorivivens lipolytica TaxID=1524264 RepID=A0A7W4W426_9GAMM|nr:5'-methylthioinosine phosphorylase [Litorivivens lipolytica]
MSDLIAIIGGTGLCDWQGAEHISSEPIETPYGEASAPLRRMRYQGSEFVFLPRHGDGHKFPPHKINYRANIWGLKSLGISQVIAVNAVGGIHPDCGTGALVVPDQIIDYSYGREHTFYDGSDGRLDHVDLGEPYSMALRRRILAAGQSEGVALVDGGVYACTQGPRLETAAEIQRLKRDGADLVGMTAMPEAGLAREAGLDYASLCLVVNPAAGLSSEPITMDDIQKVIDSGMQTVKQVLATAVSA